MKIAEALDIASKYQENNSLAKAQKIYQKILAKQPNNQDALHGLGSLAQKMQVLQQQPEDPDALYGLGEIAQKTENWQCAEHYFRNVLRIQPKSLKTWFSLGNLYYSQTKWLAAEECYRTILDLQPNSVTVYNNLGCVLQQQDKLAEAIACYQKALERQPNCVELEVNIGNMLHRQGKLSPDQQAYYAKINNNLGVAQKVAGDLESAITYYQQALSLQPDLAISHYNLGVALQEQGKLEEAISCYQQVPELATSDAGVYPQLVRNKLNRIYKGQNQRQGSNSRERLKIAVVSAPLDTILPPKQNSIGACTYGIVRQLADCCKVIVYGLKDSEKVDDDYYEQGIHYRLLSKLPFDLWLFKQFRKYAKFSKLFNGGMTPPMTSSNWIFPLYGRQVARELALQQCDIIFFQHTSHYIPIVRALNPQAKIILNFHHERYPQSNPAQLERRLQHVDFVTCVSNYVKEKTLQDFPSIADRCQTIHNGINASNFAREKDYSKARQRKVKRIMYAGAISPEKGAHILLDAFKIVVQNYPEVQLEVCGPLGIRPLGEVSPEKEDPFQIASFYAKNYISQLQERLSPDIADKVSFTGKLPRNQLIDCFFNADIFVFPSLWDEGFGITPVEAMAAGTPVVATRSGAVVETVQDGKTGLLVEKNNAPDLATAILRLLENDQLRESMGRAAQQRALQYFTWDRAADEMLQLYETLCKPNSQ